MSVVGLDVGNDNCVVGVARQRGIDVVLNDESKRETPTIVSFTEKQRHLGSAATASQTMNPRNTVSQIKRLVGRLFQDPEVQQDIQRLPFKVTEGPDGSPLIGVQYLGEDRSFTPTQILAMILSDLKGIAAKNLAVNVADCVIGIPVYFMESQRRAYLDAAAIAGLTPLRLMHETTATALAYGIYRTDLPDSEPMNVAFVDIGHSSMQVCIAAFKKGQLKILGQGFDRSFGGRDFDEILFRHFCKKFKDEYKINVVNNPRASLRLRIACEKLKKILSANAEAPLNIECLMDEKDVRGFMKRADFEELSEPLLQRVKGPCQRAMAEANLSVDKIHSVELVGSGSRIPAILKKLSDFFKKEPGRTMNASECVARGCALQCAMLSPTFRVREFQVQDSFPFPIAVSWKGQGAEEDGTMNDNQASNIVFVKGNTLPTTKMVTFYRSNTFNIDVVYADTKDLPPGTNPQISTFTIGPIRATKLDKPKLKVKICLNLHGIVSVESATLIEEEEEVPVLVSKDAKGATAAMEVDNADGSKAGPPVDRKDVDDFDNGSTYSEEKLGKAKGEEQTKSGKKKKSKRKDVPVSVVVVGGLAPAELAKAQENELRMQQQDRIMEETKDRKNALEAYVYDMRNKLVEKYQDYAIDSEREVLQKRLQDMEDWLYEDGEDERKSVYIEKLSELKKLGDPIEERFKEEESRMKAILELDQCIASFRAATNNPSINHIAAADKEKVISECKGAEEWLIAKKEQQSRLPRSANPVLLTADIKKKMDVLDRFCKPILNKGRPAPPKPSGASSESQRAESDKSHRNGESPPSETDDSKDDSMETD